jgi:hypothetical protein
MITVEKKERLKVKQETPFFPRGRLHQGVILFSLVLIFFQHSLQASTQRQNACAANMRVIQGAVEMYNLDHGVSPLPIDSGKLLGILVSENYLKSFVLCPGPKYTFGTTRGPSGIMEVWFPEAFFVEDPAFTSPEYRINALENVFCTFHGEIDEIPVRAKEAREKKYGKLLIPIMDLLNLPSPFGYFVFLGILVGFLSLCFWGFSLFTRLAGHQEKN